MISYITYRFISNELATLESILKGRKSDTGSLQETIERIRRSMCDD